MVRLHRWQMERLGAGLGLDAVGRVEAHLRAHYAEDCAHYEPEALRAWIADALRGVTARGVASIDDVLVRVSARWVLRGWLGEPGSSKGAPR